MKRSIALAFGFVAAAFTVAAAAYAVLPAGTQIAVRYGLDGRPIGFAGKAFGLFILPAITAMVIAALALIPVLGTTFNRGKPLSQAPFGVLIAGVAAILFVAEAALAAHAFDPRFDILRATFLATGVMLVALGNLLGKLRHNFVFGLRTPWTLADATVWDKTHRFAGRVMFATGLVLAAVSALVADYRALITAVVLCAVTPIVAGAAYSRMLAPKRP